jgi:DNA topoisomerase VI subunit B
VVIKELVDNALDACEETGVQPKILVRVDERGITVIDNGPGIPSATIEGVLDFDVRTSSRAAYVAPDRGAQGNALKTLVAMPYVLHGECGRVLVSALGVDHEVTFDVDRIRQQPRIGHETSCSEVKSGTHITVEWPDSACSILHHAKHRFLQIAEDFVWLNPHLTLSLEWGDDRRGWTASDPSWRKWLPSDPTCPHWYRADDLERLIANCISKDDEDGSSRTVREFIRQFRGFTGSAKQKRVLDDTGLHRTALVDLAKHGSMDAAMVGSLLGAMEAHSRPVKAKALGVIGNDHIRSRMEAVGCEMESFQYRKVEDTEDGVPYIIEVAFGHRPGHSRRLITGVNWSPGILNPFRELGCFGQSLDTVLSQARADRDEPIIIVLHMTCPRVEYQDRGKSAVVV